MCVKCDLGHPEACDNAAPEWLVDATDVVVSFLDDIAAAADDETLDERSPYQDAERIVLAVVAVLDARSAPGEEPAR